MSKIAIVLQTEPEPRDYALGWVCYSCQIGQHERCGPKVRARANADNVAPMCVCDHGARVHASASQRQAEADAEREDRLRVYGS